MSHCYCGFPLVPLSEGNLCERCLLHLNEKQKLLTTGKRVGGGVASVKLVAALENVTPVLGMTLLDEIDTAWFRMEYKLHLSETVIPSVAINIVEEYATCNELIEVTYASHDANVPGGPYCGYGFSVYFSTRDNICLTVYWDDGVEGESKVLLYNEKNLRDFLKGSWSDIESVDLIREFWGRYGGKAKEIERIYCINELIQCLPKSLWEYKENRAKGYAWEKHKREFREYSPAWREGRW